MSDTRVFRAIHFQNRRREVVSDTDPTPINVQPGEMLYDPEENKLYAGLDDTTVAEVGAAATKTVKLTQAEYDALTPAADTVYMIVG
jgi:hypothetical protein